MSERESADHLTELVPRWVSEQALAILAWLLHVRRRPVPTQILVVAEESDRPDSHES